MTSGNTTRIESTEVMIEVAPGINIPPSLVLTAREMVASLADRRSRWGTFDVSFYTLSSLRKIEIISHLWHAKNTSPSLSAVDHK